MVTAADLNYARNRLIAMDDWIRHNTYPNRKPPVCRAKYDQAVRIRARARQRYKALQHQWAKECRERKAPLWDSRQITQIQLNQGTRWHDSTVRHEGLE